MFCLTLLLPSLAAASALAGFENDGSGVYSYPGAAALRALKRDTQVTRYPCSCNVHTESCSCCGRVDQTSTNFSGRSCGTVIYGQGKNRPLRYEVSLNNSTIRSTEATVSKNPVELCVPTAFLTICTKFFNVEYQNATFTFCFRFDVKISRFTLFAVEFDCVRVGLAPGIDSKINFAQHRLHFPPGIEAFKKNNTKSCTNIIFI